MEEVFIAIGAAVGIVAIWALASVVFAVVLQMGWHVMATIVPWFAAHHLSIWQLAILYLAVRLVISNDMSHAVSKKSE